MQFPYSQMYIIKTVRKFLTLFLILKMAPLACDFQLYVAGGAIFNVSKTVFDTSTLL